MSTEALEAVARILEQRRRGGRRPAGSRRRARGRAGVAWAAVAFLEEGRLVVGPQAGVPDESSRRRVQVTYEGAHVGELWVDGEADQSFSSA